MKVHIGVTTVTVYKIFYSGHRHVLVIAVVLSEVNQDPWLLLREVNCRPLLTFFWEEQGADHGAQLWIAGRDLLKVGRVHRNAARHRPAVVRA